MDDSVKISVDKDVADVKLRMRVRKYDEENITLREDLAQSEDLIANLKRQCANLEHQLYVCFAMARENVSIADRSEIRLMRNGALC